MSSSHRFHNDNYNNLQKNFYSQLLLQPLALAWHSVSVPRAGIEFFSHLLGMTCLTSTRFRIRKNAICIAMCISN